MRVVAPGGLLFVSLTLAAGCGSNSKSTALAPLQTVDMPNLRAVSGSEDVVATYWAPAQADSRDTLQVLRQDPANADRLLLSASVPLQPGFAVPRDVAITSDWAVVTVPAVVLVKLSPTPALVGTVDLGADAANIPITPDRAVAHSGFLFVAAGAKLRVYSLVDPAHPALTASFDAPGPVHAVAAVPAGFLAFGDGMMVALSNPSNPAWSTKSDVALPFARKAITAGAQIVVAGQGHVAGRSQIARLDATDPANASILLSADDLPVEYADSAWDGSTTYCVFGPGTTTAGFNTSPLLLLHEESGKLREADTLQVWPVYGGGLNHAWKGHLYRAELALKAYRLP
jgi:hypothetical protein